MTKMPGLDSYRDINDRFKETRIDAGYTQEDFAKQLGISLSMVKQIETERATPNIFILRQWKKVFHKSYNWIFEGKEKPVPEEVYMRLKSSKK